MALWTLKEAHVKARGLGISAPPGLRGFAMQLSEWGEQQARQPGEQLPGFARDGAAQGLRYSISIRSEVQLQQQYRYLLFRPDQEHLAALAVELPVAGGGGDGGSDGGSDGCGQEQHGGEQQGRDPLKVHMWRCLPLGQEQEALDVADVVWLGSSLV